MHGNSVQLTINFLARPEDANIYPEGEYEFYLVEKLRDLPGRRTVWKARVNEKDILLKVYHKHAKQNRDVDAEWGNAMRLKECKLKVAAPLFRCSGKNDEIALAFEYIDGGEIFATHVERSNNPSQVLKELFEMHARQHNAGCYQSDNHLGNYLCAEGDLYMLDAGSFVFHQGPLPNKERVNNLAMLMANIPLPCCDLAERAMDSYLELRPEGVDKSVMSREVLGARGEAIQVRLRKYFKKTRRSCTEFYRKDWDGKTWFGYRKLPSELEKALQSDPDQFFDTEELLKDGNTCTVTKLTFEGKSYVLKRYNKKPLGYQLSHVLLPSRALKSWTNGHVLNLFGIKTPKPQACLVIRSRGLVQRSYLLMENIEGETLDRVNSERILSPESPIPKAFANRWAELESIGASHGDMKASNLIVTPEGDLILIDLDGLKFDKSDQEHQRRREKDMKRFMKNWEGKPELIKVFQEALIS